MKMRLLVLLCCLFFGANPWVSHAGDLGDLIEPLLSGQINWTRGVVVAQGFGSSEPAIDNVVQAVVQVRLDTRTTVLDRVGSNPQMWAQVKEMAVASKLVARDICPDGRTRVTVEMNLSGGFAQLLLPAEIKQVEPIKPLTGTFSAPEMDKGAAGADGVALEAYTYTGLIVDARGIGVTPAMVPVLTDESGKAVYSPAFVSREFAVQQGVCQYVRHADGLAGLSRVAPKPLLVKGLRTAVTGKCDIVISNADASKLHGASAHLKFLRECRVIIVMD
jgi:hypothetical protein